MSSKNYFSQFSDFLDQFTQKASFEKVQNFSVVNVENAKTSYKILYFIEKILFDHLKSEEGKARNIWSCFLKAIQTVANERLTKDISDIEQLRCSNIAKVRLFIRKSVNRATFVEDIKMVYNYSTLKDLFSMFSILRNETQFSLFCEKLELLSKFKFNFPLSEVFESLNSDDFWSSFEFAELNQPDTIAIDRPTAFEPAAHSFSRISAIENSFQTKSEPFMKRRHKERPVLVKEIQKDGKNEKEKIILDFRQAITSVQKSVATTNFIDDSNLHGEKLLAVLHQVFLNNILPNSSPFKFLSLLEKCLPQNEQVTNLFRELAGAIGDEEAEKGFYKLSLNLQMLKEFTEILIFHRNLIRVHYNQDALLCSEKYIQSILLLFLNLERIQFRFKDFTSSKFLDSKTQKSKLKKKPVKRNNIDDASISSSVPVSIPRPLQKEGTYEEVIPTRQRTAQKQNIRLSDRIKREDILQSNFEEPQNEPQKIEELIPEPKTESLYVSNFDSKRKSSLVETTSIQEEPMDLDQLNLFLAEETKQTEIVQNKLEDSKLSASPQSTLSSEHTAENMNLPNKQTDDSIHTTVEEIPNESNENESVFVGNNIMSPPISTLSIQIKKTPQVKQEEKRVTTALRQLEFEQNALARTFSPNSLKFDPTSLVLTSPLKKTKRSSRSYFHYPKEEKIESESASYFVIEDFEPNAKPSLELKNPVKHLASDYHIGSVTRNISNINCATENAFTYAASVVPAVLKELADDFYSPSESVSNKSFSSIGSKDDSNLSKHFFSPSEATMQGGIYDIDTIRTFSQSTITTLSLEEHIQSRAVRNQKCICGQRLSYSVKGENAPRFCVYFGTFFCHNCHHNNTSIIPFRCVFQWDASLARVSDKAKQIITQEMDTPVFNLRVLSPKIFRTIPELKTISMLRHQLKLLGEFILSCKSRDTLLSALKNRKHTAETAELYSLSDIQSAISGKLAQELNFAVSLFVRHITESCESCRGKGYFCEYCQSNEVLFSFQLSNTHQCPRCRTVFHRSCALKHLFTPSNCPKCQRIYGIKKKTYIEKKKRKSQLN